ncbi:MAG TPA: GxxExxY protein [Desulfomonilia bacterium]
MIHEGHEGARRMTELILKDEVFAIVGAAIEVHRELGPGFLEAVYQEAFEMELRDRGIPFEAQKLLRVSYKGKMLNKEYCADLICYGQIIVELKALDRLSGNEEAQILNYLKATGLRVGVLINFGSHGKLEWKRFIH